MTRTCYKLTASIVLMLTMLFGLLIMQSASVTASASDTVLYLNQENRVLGTNYFKTGAISGKIAGDVSSTYYVYAIPDDESICTAQEGYTMTSTSFKLNVTAKKAGKTSVKVAVKDTKKGAVVASGFVQVTVKSLDVNALSLSTGGSYYDGISGNTKTLKCQIYSVPAGVSFKLKTEGVNKNSVVAIEWTSGIKNKTSFWEADMKLVYLKPGKETIKLHLTDSAGNIILTKSFDITVSYSIYDNNSQYTVNVDLNKSAEFSIYPRFSSTTLTRKNYYTLPNTITCKNAASGTWTFKASATGTYTLSVYAKISYKDKWYEIGRKNYTIKVTNSKPATTKATTRKVTTTTTTTTTAAPTKVIPPGSYNGNTYQLYDGAAKSWEDAKAYCEKLGGHLAVINNADENAYLYKYITQNGYKGAYFGLADPFQSGNWIWVTGSSNYTNWHAGEPSSKTEPYGMFYYKFTDGTWNDAKWGDNTTAFLCEWEGSPAVTTLTSATAYTNTTTSTAILPNVEEWSLEMEVGEETELGGAAEDGFTYECSNPDVLYVDEDGYVYAIEEGEAVIIVSLDGTPYIRIYVDVLEDDGEDFDEYTLELKEGETFSLDEFQDEFITFESSNTEVAVVDENGMITAIKQGAAAISIYDEDVEIVRIYLDVQASDEKDYVEYEEKMVVGESFFLTDIWDNFDAADIDNEDVLMLRDNYEVVAFSEGNAVVSIYGEQKEKYRIYITVTAAEEKKWEDINLELSVDSTYLLDEDRTLHYVSEDEDIAYILEDAFIVAYKPGKTQINVLRGDDVLYTINLTVTGETDPNSQDDYDIMLTVGEDTSLEEFYEEGVICISSDPSIASISEDHRLVAHKAGITIITMQKDGNTIYKVKLRVFSGEEISETTTSAASSSETTTTTTATAAEQIDTKTASETTTATTTSETTTTTTSKTTTTTASETTTTTTSKTTTTTTSKTTTTTTSKTTTTTTSETTTTTTANETTTTTTANETAATTTASGDVNGDGTVNLKDVVMIRRYIAGGWDVTLNKSAADLNGDGTINLKDVVKLRRAIAGGWDN